MTFSTRTLMAPLVLAAFTALPLSASADAHNEKSDVEIMVPETVVTSGTYKNDPSHSSMAVSLIHLGFAPYAVQFSDVEATLDLDLDDPSKSSVSFDLDPASVFTSYRGDYQATHEKSEHATWEEAIAKDFLGADTQAIITFRSTTFEYDGDMTGTVFGDLSMNGVTKPAEFEIEITGEGLHPFSQKEGLGIVAEGSILRADYGIAQKMNGLLSDEVTISFSADFLKAEDSMKVGE